MMFGESRSESPRLPSPWQRAIATSKVVPLLSPSPLALDVMTTRKSMTSLVSELQKDEMTPMEDVAAPDELPPALLSRSTSTAHSDSLGSSSFTSDPEMQSRLWSSGVSESLILSPEAAASGATKLAAESDRVGHIEYKLKLNSTGVDRFEKLTTQLNWRLTEGGGEAMYEIGVMDDGTLVGISRQDMEQSLRTLELMASELGATVMVLKTITLTGPPPEHACFGPPPSDSTDKFSDPAPLLSRTAQLRRKKRLKREKKVKEREQQRATRAARDHRPNKPPHPTIPRKPFQPKRGQTVYDTASDSCDSGKQEMDVKGKSPLRSRSPSLDDLPFAESWKERNLQRAMEEDRRRREMELEGWAQLPWVPANDLQEQRRHRRRWKRHRPPKSEEADNVVAIELDDNDIFSLDIDEARAPDALTSEALSAFTASQVEHRPRIVHMTTMNSTSTSEAEEPPAKKKQIPPRIAKRRPGRASKAEHRRQELLKGDGAGQGMLDQEAMGGFDLDGSEDDMDVQDLLSRVAGVTRTPRSRPKSGLVSTSPTFTLKPSSPGGPSIFSLTLGDVGAASPSDTITQPLDNLSLSFSQAEVCTVDEISSDGDNDDQGEPTVLPSVAADGAWDVDVRVCVEAIVVKKRDMDERFGFLDFGGWVA